MQEIIRKYVDCCIEQGIWCSDYHSALRSFDNYCVMTYPDTSSVYREMLNLWCKPLTGESRKRYLKRICALSDFVSVLFPAIVMSEPENVARWQKSLLAKEFTSTGAGLFNQFVSHRTASGCRSVAYDRALRSFDMHCAIQYPEATSLTQEMVDTRCAIRPTENLYSCGKRTAAVNAFLLDCFFQAE